MNPLELFEKLIKWTRDTITQKRLTNGESGYQWSVKDLEYEGDFTLEDLQDFFDREQLNSDYKREYEKDEVADKKAYGFSKTDAALIAGFHRSFAARHKTRLQLYRDDLSMKGKRVPGNIYNTLGKHEAKKQAVEEL